ncbi:cupin domain-containing protein [Eubacteriales bacterium OttesenSCG-928-A19]|nr:cupin domain-containing protein [Eubacteriales bacterium OttesenSCG-928-A19]
MVRKENDMQVEVRKEMRGGKGEVLLRHLEKDGLPENGRLFAKLTLAPGCSIGPHTHTGEAEVFYFAHGEGVVTDDGVAIPVKAGDSMTTLDGHAHNVENTGTEDLVIIATIIKS